MWVGRVSPKLVKNPKAPICVNVTNLTMKKGSSSNCNINGYGSCSGSRSGGSKQHLLVILLCAAVAVWAMASLFSFSRFMFGDVPGCPCLPCDSEDSNSNANANASASASAAVVVSPYIPLRPRRRYKSNGFLLVSCNGGLNQMRAGICDMVAVARSLNLTLVIPMLDKTSFWNDSSDFEDVFDAEHFIDSLRDEVRIIYSLPRRYWKSDNVSVLSKPPISWSSEQYYLTEILPLFREHRVIHFTKTDARMANNGIPVELQKLRCRVNYEALRFTPQIRETGNRLISNLQKRGSFVVLHLRYEMDMLAFSGCTRGCSATEVDELTRKRYAVSWWKDKEIDSEKQRQEGHCPLTPEETALILKALDIKKTIQIYIAAGKIYGGERRLAALRADFPNLFTKEMLLSEDELQPFQNHSSLMAALDYMVSLASDIFIPTYHGNMAKLVEGHRRYLGFKTTYQLNQKGLVDLLDNYQNGTMSWDEFSFAVTEMHAHLKGQPRRRTVSPESPKLEDYFYANPEECLGPLTPESTAAI